MTSQRMSGKKATAPYTLIRINLTKRLFLPSIHTFDRRSRSSENGSFLTLPPTPTEWINRPFPSYFDTHNESEAKCKAFIMKINFHSSANKTHFHKKSFALNLPFIKRF